MLKPSAQARDSWCRAEGCSLLGQGLSEHLELNRRCFPHQCQPLLQLSVLFSCRCSSSRQQRLAATQSDQAIWPKPSSTDAPVLSEFPAAYPATDPPTFDFISCTPKACKHHATSRPFLLLNPQSSNHPSILFIKHPPATLLTLFPAVSAALSPARGTAVSVPVLPTAQRTAADASTSRFIVSRCAAVRAATSSCS